jgi:hypothetical protein
MTMENTIRGEQIAEALQGLSLNISVGRDPQQNWNRNIHATAFSGGNDPLTPQIRHF